MVGNLGNYQRIVMWSAKVKGPMKLLAITAGLGYAGLRGVEYLATKQVDKIKASKKEKETNEDPIIE